MFTGNVTQALKLQLSTVGIWKLYQKNGFTLHCGILSTSFLSSAYLMSHPPAWTQILVCCRGWFAKSHKCTKGKETKSGMGLKTKLATSNCLNVLQMTYLPRQYPPSSCLIGGSGSCSCDSSGKEASTCKPAGKLLAHIIQKSAGKSWIG